MALLLSNMLRYYSACCIHDFCWQESWFLWRAKGARHFCHNSTETQHNVYTKLIVAGIQTICNILSSLSDPLFIELYGKAVSTARSCHLRHSNPQQTILKPGLQIFKIHRFGKGKRALEASHRPLGEAIADSEACRLLAALLILTNFALFPFDGLSCPCFGRFISQMGANTPLMAQVQP